MVARTWTHVIEPNVTTEETDSQCGRIQQLKNLSLWPILWWWSKKARTSLPEPSCYDSWPAIISNQILTSVDESHCWGQITPRTWDILLWSIGLCLQQRALSIWVFPSLCSFGYVGQNLMPNPSWIYRGTTAFSSSLCALVPPTRRETSKLSPTVFPAWIP